MANYGIQFNDGKGNNYFPNPFPIGAVYLSVTNVNPRTYFGGSWERICKGQYLIGVDENTGMEHNAPNKAFGNWYTDNTSLSVNQMPSHTHSQNAHMHWVCDRHSDGRHIRAVGWYGWAGGSALPIHCGTGASQCDANVYGMLADYTTATNNYTGGGAGHNHHFVPPSFTVYVWKRVA